MFSSKFFVKTSLNVLPRFQELCFNYRFSLFLTNSKQFEKYSNIAFSRNPYLWFSQSIFSASPWLTGYKLHCKLVKLKFGMPSAKMESYKFRTSTPSLRMTNLNSPRRLHLPCPREVSGVWYWTIRHVINDFINKPQNTIS